MTQFRIELTKNRNNKILLFIASTVLAGSLAGIVVVNSLVAILLTISFICFVILCKTPFSVILVIFALAPFTGAVKVFFEVREIPLAFDIILVIATLHGFFQNLLDRETSIKEGIYQLPVVSPLILIFLLVGLLGILNPTVPNLKFGLEGFRLSVFYFIAFFAAWFLCNSKDDVLNLAKTLMLISLFVALYGIFQFFNPSPAEVAYFEDKIWGGQMQAFSTMIGNVHFAMFMVLAGLGAISFSVNNYKIERVPYKIIIFLTIVGLLFSLSRASWLAMFLGIITILFFSAKRMKFASFLKTMTLFSALVLLILVAMRNLDVIQKRILTLANPYDSALLTRLQIWPDLIDRINLFGYGIGVAGFNQYVNIPGLGVLWADNQFIKVALEMGYLGLFLFCLILVLIVIKGFRLSTSLEEQSLRAAAIWITAFSIGIIFKMLTGQVLEAYPINMYFCFLAGVLYKLEYIEEKWLTQK